MQVLSIYVFKRSLYISIMDFVDKMMVSRVWQPVQYVVLLLCPVGEKSPVEYA